MTRTSQKDFKRDGKWVQRAYVEDKYTWTESGVLWNNVKERCTVGGATQLREPTYVGSVNEFTSFQEFTEWHRNQIGYGLGYQLDADILKRGNKIYSVSHCVLIPPALNKFLQTSKGKRGDWPQGVYFNNRRGLLCAAIGVREHKGQKYLGSFPTHKLEEARELYRVAKNEAAKFWYADLASGKYLVDPRVTEYMRTWEHVCDWEYR